MKFSLQGNSLQKLFLLFHNATSMCTFINVRLKFLKKNKRNRGDTSK